MKLQNKLNKLIGILDTMSNKSKRDYAVSLLSSIITEINKLGNEINRYYSKEHLISNPDVEIEKYILALMIYGHTQEGIESIKKETLIFVNKYKQFFNKQPTARNILDIQLMLYDFIITNDRDPENFQEFKNYVDEARNS